MVPGCREQPLSRSMTLFHSAYQIAQVHAYRGESDKSFEWLERAYKQRDTGLPTLNTDPLFNTLRHDPRYTELLKKMRLPI